MSDDNDKKIDAEDEEAGTEEIDEDIMEIMNNNDLDEEAAERVKELMDELGIDEDEAVDLEENE
jgi:energy-coupling factor transporter ATP-binding protein EcfA2